MNEQEMKKSVETVVDEILKKEEATPTPDLEKAKKEDEKEEKKSEKDDDKDDKDDKKPASLKKAEDEKEEEDEKEDDEKKEDDKEEKKKPSKKMKKSLEELAEQLDEEELELIKAWREEADSEEIIKSETAPTQNSEDLQKALSAMIDERMTSFTKILDEKETLIKSLNEKVEKISAQPAYDRRSISSLEIIEKSNEGSSDIKKSQVTQKMLDLQLAGKGVTSHHVAEFEATNNISDANVRNLVFKELKLN